MDADSVGNERLDFGKRILLLRQSSFVIGIAVWALMASSAFAQGWTTKASLAYQRDNLAVAVQDGVIYALGGAPAGISVLDYVEAYDPALDAWAIKAPMLTPRYGPSAASINGFIYAIGGTSSVDGSLPINSMEVYDPVTNTWSFNVPGTSAPLVPMPTGRWGFDTAVVDGIIYAIGGALRNITSVTGETLISSSVGGQSYTTAHNNAQGTVSGSSVVVKVGGVAKTLGADYMLDSTHTVITIVAGGGIPDGSLVTVDYKYWNDTFYGTVEAYDPQTNTWTTKASMPTPRYGATVSVVNGYIYAIGGWGGWPELSVVEVYDSATNTWSTTVPGTATPLAPMPTPRDDFGFGVVNGVIYAMGGDINGIGVPAGVVDGITFNGTCCTNVMEAYDTAANTWSTSTPMPTTDHPSRDDFDSAVVDGVIYAIAGSLDGPPSAPTYGGVSFTTVEAFTSSDISAPSKPSASVASGQATISWQPVTGATSYNIYWSTKPGVTTASGTKATGVTSPYTHTWPTAGAWYYYVVTAVTAAGESPPSNEVAAHTFSFASQTGVPLNSTITSNTIRILTPNSGGAVSITGGMYSINGGAYTSSAGAVAFGDTLTVRLTSAASYATPVAATLTIGGVSGIFTVTTVDKASQIISFGAAPSMVVGGSGTVNATASSGLAVSYASATPAICSVSGNTVTGLAAGVCTIAASQAGDADYYNAAPTAAQDITVGKGSQTISFGAAPTVAFGGAGVVSAAASSGLAVSYASTTPAICSVSGNTVTGLAAGVCTIAANQAGNANYHAAPAVTQDIAIRTASGKYKTSLTLSASLYNTLSGKSVSLIASIGGGNDPAGTISFAEGFKIVCAHVAVSNAKATCTVGSFAVGRHELVAYYAGDASHLDSLSASVTVKAVDRTPSCASMPSYSTFKDALISARQAVSGDNGNDVWGVMMDRIGTVCAVAYTGSSISSQWFAGRLLSSALANTANAISTEKAFLSSANLYSQKSSGWADIDGFGLPVDASKAYSGNSGRFGSSKDPLVGKRPGGWQVFGGGLAMMDMYGRKTGGIGVSGTTSCTSHNIAWKLRGLLNMDFVPGGLGPDISRPDNILYMGIVTDPELAQFTHPECSTQETIQTGNLSAVQH